MDDPEHPLEIQRLQALSNTGLLTTASFPELDALCQRAKEQFRVAMAMVTLIARDVLIAKARAGTDLEEAPRVGQFCDYTIRSDNVFVVPDATRDPRFATNPLVTGAPFVRFYAGAPLIYRRHIRLGALCLLHTERQEFSLGDGAELETMADEAMSAIVWRELGAGFSPVRPSS